MVWNQWLLKWVRILSFKRVGYQNNMTYSGVKVILNSLHADVIILPFVFLVNTLKLRPAYPILTNRLKPTVYANAPLIL